jgi:hypothetical protein
LRRRPTAIRRRLEEVLEMRTKNKVAVAVAAAALVGGAVTTASAAPAQNTPDKPSQVTDTATVPPRVFAVINADGTKARGKAVASSQRLGAGAYDVRFNRNISTCSWTGTVGLGTFGGSTGPAMLTLSGRAGTNNGLFVTTFNQSGSPTDLPFHVLVVCG